MIHFKCMQKVCSKHKVSSLQLVDTIRYASMHILSKQNHKTKFLKFFYYNLKDRLPDKPYVTYIIPYLQNTFLTYLIT